MRENFEGTRNRVIDGCSRGGGRLCKEDVGWIVDLNNFLASWSLRSDMVALLYGILCSDSTIEIVRIIIIIMMFLVYFCSVCCCVVLQVCCHLV